MSEMTPADPNGPLMRAWVAYQATPEYDNSRQWAAIPRHREGSLWAAFEAGFAAGVQSAARAREEPPA